VPGLVKISDTERLVTGCWTWACLFIRWLCPVQWCCDVNRRSRSIGLCVVLIVRREPSVFYVGGVCYHTISTLCIRLSYFGPPGFCVIWTVAVAPNYPMQSYLGNVRLLGAVENRETRWLSPARLAGGISATQPGRCVTDQVIAKIVTARMFLKHDDQNQSANPNLPSDMRPGPSAARPLFRSALETAIDAPTQRSLQRTWLPGESIQG
jgi:hypothetical protein